MTDYSHVEQLTRQSNTNFYCSFLFLPKAKREALFTIYAYCRHTDNIVDEIADPGEARRALDAWRVELDACFEGHPSHPITQALSEINRTYAISKKRFEELIDGCEMDLERKRYATFAELERYCYHVAGAVGLMCLNVFGSAAPRIHEYAVNLGAALQLTNIMRDVSEDARIGRIYLPAEEMERFGYSEEELMRNAYTPAFVDLMRFQAERAHGYYREAAACFEPRDRHLLYPAEIMRDIYFNLLRRIEAVEYNVFDNRVRVPGRVKAAVVLKQWAKSWLRGVVA